jgi:hypothetical protein
MNSKATEAKDEDGGLTPSADPLRLVNFPTRSENGLATHSEIRSSKPGRPRVHADKAALQAAYRSRNRIISVRLESDAVQYIQETAALRDLSMTELVSQMLKHSRSTRDWRTAPLFGCLLPNVGRKTIR